jgi:type VI secretion system protein ImpI/type VI secretion system protein
MTVTLRFQTTGMVPNNAQPLEMRGTSMTVGRSVQNDVVLPDPEKMISGRHCAIEDHGGNIVVIDLSTNGTFLNYGKLPLGRTPSPINDGDILSIGSYELLVQISVAQAAAHDLAPLDVPDFMGGAAGVAPSMLDPIDDGDDFLDGLLGGPTAGPDVVVRDQLGDDGLMPPLGDDFGLMDPAPDPAHNLGASMSSHSSPLSDVMQTPSLASSAIPDDWDLETSVETGPLQQAVEPSAEPSKNARFIPNDNLGDDFLGTTAQPTHQPTQPAMTAPPVQPAPVARPLTGASSSGSQSGARAFLDAVGAADLDIPDHELDATLTRLGKVTRMMILGAREILMTRTHIKSEFRINQTVISVGRNNPLKFSVSEDHAIESMVKPTTKGYLDADEAAAEGLKDIKAHEVAMMTGMEAALKGILSKLEPSALAKVIEADSGFRSVLTNKKARYWDTFEAKYQEISDQAENDFHDLFSKEFARAYQDQLERLK